MANLSMAEIAKLPKYAKAHAGKVYKLNEHCYIDNVHGIGASKTHQDIATRGFISFQAVDTFLAMCGDEVNQEKVAQIVERIRAGEGVACPRLFLDIENYMAFVKNSKCIIVDHDGCEAVAAMKIMGVESVTVQIVLLGYSMRNIENRSDFFNHLSVGVLSQHGQQFDTLVAHVG